MPSIVPRPVVGQQTTLLNTRHDRGCGNGIVRELCCPDRFTVSEGQEQLLSANRSGWPACAGAMSPSPYVQACIQRVAAGKSPELFVKVLTNVASIESVMIVKIVPNEKGNSHGKLADAELHFTDGVLEGLKLIGFAVWERPGGQRTVTFPAREYSFDGERRSFALLRPIEKTATHERATDLVLQAYAEYLAAATQAAS